MKHAALFLDRDGVINENRPNYVRSIADLTVYPFALTTLRDLARLPIKLIIITNQSAVGRGIISREQADAINQYVVASVEAAGGRIDAVYMCPHSPDAHCSCRKPLPGMLLRAAHDLALDLTSCALVGDAASDMRAGYAAGIRQLSLVNTGRGIAQFNQVDQTVKQVVHRHANLCESAQSLHYVVDAVARLSFRTDRPEKCQ